MGKIKEKIKKLRNFKVYDYSIFEANDLSAAQSYISRASARGELVKLGKGKFAKIGNQVIRSDLCAETSDNNKQFASLKNIRISKYPEFREFFWSNQDGALYIDNYIACIMQYDIVSKIAGLIAIFGFLNIFRVYLNEFKSKGETLTMFEGYVYE